MYIPILKHGPKWQKVHRPEGPPAVAYRMKGPPAHLRDHAGLS